MSLPLDSLSYAQKDTSRSSPFIFHVSCKKNPGIVTHGLTFDPPPLCCDWITRHTIRSKMLDDYLVSVILCSPRHHHVNAIAPPVVVAIKKRFQIQKRFLLAPAPRLYVLLSGWRNAVCLASCMDDFTSERSQKLLRFHPMTMMMMIHKRK